MNNHQDTPNTPTEAACYYCGHSNMPQAEHCTRCGTVLILQQRYRILRVLGQGGFGLVYEAQDTRLRRHCAIKQVKSSSLAEQKQIQNEVDILAQQASRFAFIPTIQDTWVDQQQTYLVMEFIDGPTLDEVQPWTVQAITHFLRVMLENLAQLHAAGIIHRDIKPQNIKHTPAGRCPYMLLDFGIAKQGAASSVKALSPDYAPPEQIQGIPTDARSDLYSLAATAYVLLTGRSPLRERVQGNGTLPTPARFVPDISPALEMTLLRLLEQEPASRPPDARAALALLDSDPSQPRATIKVALGTLGQLEPAPPVTSAVPDATTQTAENATPATVAAPTRRRPHCSVQISIALALMLMLVGGGITSFLMLDAGIGGRTTTGVAQQPTATAELTAAPVTTQIAAGEAPTEASDGEIPAETATPRMTEVAMGEAPTEASDGETGDTPDTRSNIAFVSDRDGNSDIFVLEIEGSSVQNIESRPPRNLTSNPANDTAPAWSPDGEQIAFASFRESNWDIYVLDADGGNLRRLTTDEASDKDPAWSPDGETIAFTSDRDGNEEIYLMSADGGNQRNLTQNPARESMAAWAPDSAELVFVSDRSGNEDIYTIAAAGGEALQLTDAPESDSAPAWSPDGSSIAFTSLRTGNREVFLMDADSSEQRNVSNTPLFPDGNPAWSPDGTLLAFESHRDDNGEIYVMDVDGFEQRNLTNDSSLDAHPAWCCSP